MVESVLSLLNGVVTESGCYERGLAYGDGFFETIRLQSSVAPLWNLHCDRMLCSAKRLGIHLTRARLDETFAVVSTTLSSTAPLLILKIIITRSLQTHESGNRGTYGAVGANANILVDVMPFSDRKYVQSGLSIRLCDLPLTEIPLLAGMKHLNRLNYILLANSVSLNFLEQVLFMSANETVIETMHHNIFIVKDGCVKTPMLGAVGVSGVMRRHILDLLPLSSVQNVVSPFISIDELKDADEVFLTNAVDGVVSVNEFNFQNYKVKYTDYSICELLKVKLKPFCGTESAAV